MLHLCHCIYIAHDKKKNPQTAAHPTLKLKIITNKCPKQLVVIEVNYANTGYILVCNSVTAGV